MKKNINDLIKYYLDLIKHKKSNILRAEISNAEVKEYTPFIISSTSTSPSIDICNALNSLIDINIPLNKIIILCIGTDRATGDSLGPLIGQKLKALFHCVPLVVGTLESPVHGKNLHSTMENILNSNPEGFIIAIDACLGSINSLGNVNIEHGPLYPGSALNKNLSPVGDLNITAVVNSIIGDTFSTLQNTRLFTVMSIAEIISDGISKFIVSRETSQNNDE